MDSIAESVPVPSAGIDGLTGGAELQALASRALAPLRWRAERLGAPSAWWQHVPFAHWVVAATAPGCLVELGTHAGVSYSAFCAAVAATGAGTRCYAVDTWQGDHQAGEYDEGVFEEFSRFHDERYSAFSTLLRSAFDDALPRFPDGSVDLLHIDGLHTYEAVRHDYESWRPKLSERGVVLFHDINEHGGDFGVWRLWAELRDEFPSFEFVHGHGLGVLAVGPDVPVAIASLCAIKDPAAAAALRGLFARLGERWWYDTRERMASDGAAAQAAAFSVREAALRAEAAESKDAAARAEAANADVSAQAKATVADAERERLAAERRAGEAAEATRAARDAMAQALHDARTREEAAGGAVLKAEARARAAERAAARADRAAAAAAAARTAADAALRDAEAEAAVARQALARMAGEAARADTAEAARSHAELERDIVMSSTLWRATRPLRSAGRRLPGPMRRVVRGVAGAARRGGRSVVVAAPAEAPDAGSVAVPPPSVETPALEAETSVIAAAITTIPAAPPVSVVWVSGEPRTAGHVYRVERQARAAAVAGASSVTMTLADSPARLPEIEAADVVVIWRAAWDAEVAAVLDAARRGGAKIVFDVDDLMVDPSLARLDVIDGIRSQGLTEEGVRQHYERVQGTMRAADLCLASTEELAWQMRRLGMPALAVPNCFDDDTRAVSRLAARLVGRGTRAPGAVVRIGYAGGSRTHQRDFAVCADAVAEALRTRPECRLVLFRLPEHRMDCLDVGEFPALRGLEAQIEWRDVVPLADLPGELARLDINLAPLEMGNPFCEAKSELKFFEAALAGVPTVASPTGPYRRAIRHGETGFLAGSEADWRDALLRLADDVGLRRRVAARAEIDVAWRFGPERAAHEWSVVLDVLRGGEVGARAFQTLARRRLDPPAPLPGVPEHAVMLEQDRAGVAEVTVAVPLYNYGHTVIEALNSVLAQSLETLDLVVVDDGSTDGGLDTVLDWVAAHGARLNRVVVARNLVNQGLGSVRNVAFALAATPWVLALDADNRLLPGCAAACLAAARDSGAAFAYPLLRRFGDGDGTIGNPGWDPVRLSNGNYVDALALVSRAAWAGVGGYDATRTGWEDFDLWCRFAERGLWGVRVPGEPLAEYRVHGTSMIQDAMRQRDKVRWMMDHLQARHPWLTLTSPIPEPPSPGAAEGPSAATAAPVAALDRLLPLLRCPLSGSALSLTADGRALSSESGGHVWPLVDGRPVLYPGMETPRIVEDVHVSNAIGDEAEALIRSAAGPVLHLSAGGSARRYDNVIEAEAAVFRHTDVVADAHHLPFADAAFEAVIALNAFEHYREPRRAAAEILRVLKPGGRVLVRTAFMQPQHEAPWHFYNCTRHGLEAWFEGFETERLWVSDNFHAGYALSWLASECEKALRGSVSPAAADRLLAAPVGQVASWWLGPDPARGGDPTWRDLASMPQSAQEGVAAGFEYVGRRPSSAGAPR